MSKELLTELVFILDRSGSMSGLEDDTIGGYNSLIEKQKKASGKALLSTILFDNHFETIHDRLPIEVVNPLSKADYYVRGTTALLDAIGRSIMKISNIHMMIESEAKPDKVMFVITTDGYENASSEFSYEKIKQLIDLKKEKEQWEFIFLGANINAEQVGIKMGIDETHTANYHADSEGTLLNYSVLSDAIESYRKTSDLKKEWKKSIDQDYQKRKK